MTFFTILRTKLEIKLCYLNLTVLLGLSVSLAKRLIAYLMFIISRLLQAVLFYDTILHQVANSQCTSQIEINLTSSLRQSQQNNKIHNSSENIMTQIRLKNIQSRKLFLADHQALQQLSSWKENFQEP